MAKFRQVAVHERKVAGSYIGGLLVARLPDSVTRFLFCLSSFSLE